MSWPSLEKREGFGWRLYTYTSLCTASHCLERIETLHPNKISAVLNQSQNNINKELRSATDQ